MKNNLRRLRSHLWILLIAGAVIFAPITSQGTAIKVCGAAVNGCVDTGSTCVWYSPLHGWYWISAWACNGSSYVPGSFSCDAGDNGGCCNIPDGHVCPPWSCPC